MNNPVMFIDPGGDSTFVFNMKGNYLGTIDDAHENQVHFMSESDFNQYLENRGDGVSDNDFATEIRANSTAFIGKNSISDLESIINNPNNSGLESAFIGEIGGDREIRFNQLSLKYRGRRHIDANEFYQTIVKVCGGDKSSQALILMTGHTHIDEDKHVISDMHMYLSRVTIPEDRQQILNVGMYGRDSHPAIIATPYGFQLYETYGPPFSGSPIDYKKANFRFNRF